MKKLLVLSLALVLALSALALVGCSGAAKPTETAVAPAEPAATLPAGVQAIKDKGTLKVGVKADVPNFGLQDAATGEFKGMEIDLAKAVAKKMGLSEDKVKFEAVTAKTRGPLLDNGQLDLVIATFTIKPERLEQWNFSNPYYQDEVGLLVKKSSGIKSLKDLAGKTIGVAQGATSRDAVQAQATTEGVTGLKFLEFATYPEINAALESGRVDAFSVDKSILSGYVTESSEILPDGFSPQNYGVASKKGTDDLTKFINDMLDEMKANGEMDALLKKWNLGK